MSHTETFLQEAAQVIARLDRRPIDHMVELLVQTRDQGGRLFILGVGGSAGNASHAVNDFRKLAGIETYAPTDNVSELTARTNDEGWETVFAAWLAGSRLNPRDLVMVFSVGGGDRERNISANLVAALEYAKKAGARICGIVGRDGGFTAKVADVCLIVPTISPHSITTLAESFQVLIWHLLVSHPAVQTQPMKWETTAPSQV